MICTSCFKNGKPTYYQKPKNPIQGLLIMWLGTYLKVVPKRLYFEDTGIENKVPKRLYFENTGS